MPATLSRERGFSLPEVLISVVLLVLVVTTLSALRSNMSKSLYQLTEYRKLWRTAWNAAGQQPTTLPEDWQIRRVETTRQRCVSITVSIVAPSGRQGELSRLHCPQR